MTGPRPILLRWLAAAAVVPIVSALLASAPGRAAANPDPDPDAALVQQTCTACHGPSKFTNRHQTKDDWTKTVRQMIQYGADVPDGKFDPIVNYLSSHYGPTDPARRTSGGP
jgi:hypothetical protein